MSTQYLKVTSKNVLLPSGDPQPATITVDRTSGKIVSIDLCYLGEDAGKHQPNIEVIDAGEKHVLPGLVDTHVHLNEPGRTDWEGFWTGTRAAVSGGITTVVDMPLNSIPPTTTVENLEIKRKVAKGQCWTDIAFWGGVIPGNQKDLKPLISCGVKGFKCFMIESGVEEFPCVSERDLLDHMKEIEVRESNQLSLPELTRRLSMSQLSSRPHHSADPTLYETYLASRPEDMEVNAIQLITRLQENTHRSASALGAIRAAKEKGLKLTVETCFHYLSLSANSIPNGQPEFKCCPPIRNESNRDQLWKALLDGDIDCVVSDHSPCVVELKKVEEGDLMGAWGGINSLGLGLSLLWTEGRKPDRGATLSQIVDWMSKRTAEHAGLDAVKGSLAVGLDGDFVVSKEQMHFKNKLSAYEGLVLRGVVQQTFLRGHLVYDRSRGGFDGLTPTGKLL
ncbi:allantoinase [Boletus edulis BED1]|uniref:allantoinase n=1 Tax=Boletus edulis BED1 TaxID=1328754 RepID=A0AAD4C045_BOLED|nr:allantoinase [Boletus edulis BED1]